MCKCLLTLKCAQLHIHLQSKHFIFNKFPIYTYDGAGAKFSINKHETDYSTRVSFLISSSELFLWLPYSDDPPSSFGHHIIMCDHLFYPLVIAISFHNLLEFLSVRSPLSTIRSLGGLKGLSHEMDLAFDGI